MVFPRPIISGGIPEVKSLLEPTYLEVYIKNFDHPHSQSPEIRNPTTRNPLVGWTKTSRVGALVRGYTTVTSLPKQLFTGSPVSLIHLLDEWQQRFSAPLSATDIWARQSTWNNPWFQSDNFNLSRLSVVAAAHSGNWLYTLPIVATGCIPYLSLHSTEWSLASMAQGRSKSQMSINLLVTDYLIGVITSSKESFNSMFKI